jgi:predicted hydrocarbon binding protein
VELSFEPIPMATCEGGRIATIIIEFSFEAKCAIGVLRDIAEIMAEWNIPIIKVFNSNTSMIIFIDSNGIRDLARIEDAIRRVKYVKNVEIHPPDVGVVEVCPNATPKISDERVVIIRRSAFKSLINAVWGNLKVAPQMMLYIIGREIGESYYEAHKKSMKLNPEDMLKIAEKLFTVVGYGIIKPVKRCLNPLEVEYIIYDCLECGINLEAGRRVKSSLIRGIIEGYYSKLLGREVECKEEECIAMGSDKCRMVLREL